MNQLTLTAAFIYLILSTCSCDIEIGSLSGNRYRESHVTKSYNIMGLRICGRRCLHQKSCTGINYNYALLSCELLAETPEDTNLRVPDSLYSAIDSLSLVC